MRFKHKGIEYSISFSFFAVLLMLLICKNNTVIILSLVFSALHEIGHLTAAKLCGTNIMSFSLSAFGAEIKRSASNSTNYFQDAFIAFSGPAVNLLTALFSWIIKKAVFCDSVFLSGLIIVNICISLFNMLPFTAFDGGNILVSVLSCIFDNSTAHKICIYFSYAVSLPVIILSFAAFLKNPSEFYPVFISLYLLMTLIFKK